MCSEKSAFTLAMFIGVLIGIPAATLVTYKFMTPYTGNKFGECYPNHTCNDGLFCSIEDKKDICMPLECKP